LTASQTSARIRRVRLATLVLCTLALVPRSARAESAAHADALYEQARTLVAQRDFPSAIPLLEQAAAIDESLGAARRSDLANDLRQLGLSLAEMGPVDAAIARLRQAEAIFASLGALEARVLTLGDIGLAEYWSARYQDAETDFKQALALADARGGAKATPVLLANLGLVYEASGRYDEAISRYRLAREEHLRLGDEWSAAACLGNIGNVQSMRSQFPEAEASYKEALDAFARLGDDVYAANTAINLAGVYRVLGRYDEARPRLEGALATARRKRLPLTEAAALAQLGALGFAAGLYDKAEADYQRALDIYRAADVPRQIAATVAELGSVYHAWGKHAQALDAFEQSLALAEKLNLPGQAMGALGMIASVHQAEGRFEQSVSYYRRALDLAERLGAEASRATLLNSLGSALFQWCKIDDAEREYREALAISERLEKRDETARILIHLGGVRQVKGDHDAARELYLRGLELSRAVGTKSDEATALNNLGVLALAVGDHKEAAERLLAAIELTEQLRLTATGQDRRDFLAYWISTYRRLVLLHTLDNDPAAAFDAGERIRARYLAEQIGERMAAPPVRPIGIEAARRTLEAHTAILSFSNVDGEKPVAVLATREALRLQVLPGATAEDLRPCERSGDLLGHRVRVDKASPAASATEKNGRLGELLPLYGALLYKANLSPSEEEEREKLARELYARLVEPFEAQLAGKSELIIIPDGALGTLAFETLRLPDGRFLVERYHVTYLPSLGIRQLLRGRRYTKGLRPLLVLANTGRKGPGSAPQAETVSVGRLEALGSEARQRLRTGTAACDVYRALGVSAWPALPGARAEAEALGRIVPGSTILRDEAATEERLKALSRTGALRRFGSLHFATHGILVPDAPELSALILAEASSCGDSQGTEDGYLSAREIAGLDLCADFVALSACRTGLGKIYSGEGVVGLAQAFLVAGANGMSVSLSSVSDTATKELMTGLYRLRQQRGLSYAHALTAMKRAFIRRPDRRQPSFWAPFVYYGI